MLSLETAAVELGLADAETRAQAIKYNPRLRRLGLGSLPQHQKIDRLVWDNQEAVISPMQQAARELEIATPFVL